MSGAREKPHALLGDGGFPGAERIASRSVIGAHPEDAHTAADMVGELVADMITCIAPERDDLARQTSAGRR